MPGLLLSSPIATARGILNDPSAVRYSAADLLTYANDALDQLVMLVPTLFYSTGVLPCTVGETLQSVPTYLAKSLLDVRRISGGAAITRIDKGALDAYDPSWHTTAAGTAKHWMPVDDDPLRFYIYPKAPTGQVIEVSYVRIPGEFTATADTELPTSLSDAVADYIVARAEARDDEHVNSNRAAQFLASFVTKVKGN